MASPDRTSSSAGIPRVLRLDEPSVPNPAAACGPIHTLPAEEVTHFFVRAWRDPGPEGWDVRLDSALREILARANDFVPSAAGGILLDDPRAKLAGAAAPRLTTIAAYGDDAERWLGQRLPSDHGFIGRVYQTGRPHQTEALSADDPLLALVGARRVQSFLAAPVIVGASICGVLHLVDRRPAGGYTARDKELLRIFAAYMSSSIQNALDALRARKLARTDDLTGLHNARAFHDLLQDELGRADAAGSELSVLFLDLDHFKRVNDGFGHESGSFVLREIAGALRDHAPPASVLARYGGDEFVIGLPGANLERALQAAEALRIAVEALVLDEPEVEPGQTAQRLPCVTASIGVASCRDHLAPGGSLRRRENVLLRLADAAMYRAKSAGRNRVLAAEAED